MKYWITILFKSGLSSKYNLLDDLFQINTKAFDVIGDDHLQEVCIQISEVDDKYMEISLEDVDTFLVVVDH